MLSNYFGKIFLVLRMEDFTNRQKTQQAQSTSHSWQYYIDCIFLEKNDIA